MYARLFYLLHIIFNFLKGYIMSKTTNQILIDFLDFKIAMLKGEVAVCEEMRTELIRNEDESTVSPKQENIFKGDIQPEFNMNIESTNSLKMLNVDSNIPALENIIPKVEPIAEIKPTEPVSTACSLPHFVS